MRTGIVTISFNQARFLREAIESVRVSPPHELVYVIVDAGSSDGSREIIEAHRQRFSKIIFEPDQGPADGLNKGFAACDADVYGFLNSDDRFAPGALDFVASFFEGHSEADALMGAARVVDEHGRARWRKMVPAFSARRVVLGTALVVQQATFFRRRAYRATNGFNPLNRTCWDFEFFADMATKGVRFDCCDRVLADFRLHPASISGSGTSYDTWRADHVAVQKKAADALGWRPGVVNTLFARQWARLSPRLQWRRLTAH